MAKHTVSKSRTKYSKLDRGYSLIKAIRHEKEYKSNIQRRDDVVRKLLLNECRLSGPKDAIPGQLISFNYLQPRYKEELEYYDAKPMTIFFGVFQTKEGKRVIGFNIHYYPPKIRYKIMDRIFEIWRPMYAQAWEDGLRRELRYFDYAWLVEQLEKIGLTFGVRAYIPEIMAQVRVVPPKLWSKAVFTEGAFRKRSRQNILNYWKNFAPGENQQSTNQTNQASQSKTQVTF